MSQRRIHLHAIAAAAALLLICLVALSRSNPVRAEDSRKEMDFHKNPAVANAAEKVIMGEQVFRFDTFGDEAFWGDTLKLHQAIEGAKLGGVGPGVSPKTALSVGLKIDADAVPSDVANQLKSGVLNLDNPATPI